MHRLRETEKETGTESKVTAKGKGIAEGTSETKSAETIVTAAEEEMKAVPVQSAEPGSNVDVRV